MFDLRNKNKVWFGLLVGFLVPFVGYGILLVIYDWLDGIGAIEALSPEFRNRTPALFALCLNIIPFQIFKRRWMTHAMRGMIFPTLIYAIWWLFHFNVLSFG